jgi:hypothetical protein
MTQASKRRALVEDQFHKDLEPGVDKKKRVNTLLNAAAAGTGARSRRVLEDEADTLTATNSEYGIPRQRASASVRSDRCTVSPHVCILAICAEARVAKAELPLCACRHGSRSNWVEHPGWRLVCGSGIRECEERGWRPNTRRSFSPTKSRRQRSRCRWKPSGSGPSANFTDLLADASLPTIPSGFFTMQHSHEEVHRIYSSPFITIS